MRTALYETDQLSKLFIHYVQFVGGVGRWSAWSIAIVSTAEARYVTAAIDYFWRSSIRRKSVTRPQFVYTSHGVVQLMSAVYAMSQKRPLHALLYFE